MNKASNKSGLEKYYAIDGLRAFACMGIIAMHVLGNGKYDISDPFFTKLIMSFSDFVFLFMTISAFGMCCGYFQRFIDGKVEISDFYEKRYKRILPFFALLCLMDFAFSPSVSSLYEIFANMTLCFGLIPNVDISVIGVGWFIGVVFAFYMLFPFFCFLIADKRRAWFSVVVAFIMNYICNSVFLVGRKSIVYCFIYFLSGGLLFLYRDCILGNVAKYFALVICLIFVFLYFLVGNYTLIIFVFNTSIMIYALNVAQKGILINRITELLGRISYEVYLCHMLFFRVVEKLQLLKLTQNEYINYFMSFVLVLVSSSVFALSIKKIFNVVWMTIKKQIVHKNI